MKAISSYNALENVYSKKPYILMNPKLIGPSLLASDLSKLYDQSKIVIDNGADFLKTLSALLGSKFCLSWIKVVIL